MVNEWSLSRLNGPTKTISLHRSKKTDESYYMKSSEYNLAGKSNMPLHGWTFRCRGDLLEIKGTQSCFIYTINPENLLLEIFEIPPDMWVSLSDSIKLQIGHSLYAIHCTEVLHPNHPQVSLGKRAADSRPPSSQPAPPNPSIPPRTFIEPLKHPKIKYIPFQAEGRTSAATIRSPSVKSPTGDTEPIVLDNDNEPPYVSNANQPMDASQQPLLKGKTLVQEVCSIFPHIEEEFIRKRCKKVEGHKNALLVVCNQLSDLKEAPLKNKAPTPPPKKPVYISPNYSANMRDFLSLKFSCVPKSTIDRAMAKGENRLIPAYQILSKMFWEEVENFTKEWKQLYPGVPLNITSVKDVPTGTHQYKTIHFRFLKNHRNTKTTYSDDPLFTEDLKKLNTIQEQELAEKDLQLAHSINELEYKKEGALMVCPCCCEEHPFEQLTQCTDGHLFCLQCAARYAKTQMEEGNASQLICIENGCEYPFQKGQIRRFLDEKTFDYYQRQSQQNELRRSSLKGLEHCPFCEFAMILEDKETSVFTCQNTACGIDSCRKCKKRSHIPFSCKEADEDTKTSYQSKITDLMSEALVRECPGCHKRFVKENGCNKMTCACGQEMCYLCRKPISGYEHFNAPKATCKLHTKTEEDHERAIEEARTKAIKSIEKEAPKEMINQLEKEIPHGKEQVNNNATLSNVQNNALPANLERLQRRIEETQRRYQQMQQIQRQRIPQTAQRPIDPIVHHPFRPVPAIQKKRLVAPIKKYRQ